MPHPLKRLANRIKIWRLHRRTFRARLEGAAAGAFYDEVRHSTLSREEAARLTAAWLGGRRR